MKKKLTYLFLIIFLFLPKCFYAADSSKTPLPYSDNEFPQGLKDLRRFEIIALGSMPFVTLDVNIAYSLGKPVFNCMQSGDWSNYSFQNPLTASSNYSKDEIAGVIWTSVGICVGIAITDYVINLIRRNNKKRALYSNQIINIYEVEVNPDAVKLDNPYDDFYDIENVEDNQDQEHQDSPDLEVTDLSEEGL